jgi:hypothetical protein
MNWNDLPQNVRKGLISDFTNIVTRVTTNTTSSINLSVINYEEYKRILSKINLAVARSNRFSKPNLNRSTYHEITIKCIDTLKNYGSMSMYQLSQHTGFQLSVIKNFVKRDSKSIAPKVRVVKQGSSTYLAIRSDS